MVLGVVPEVLGTDMVGCDGFVFVFAIFRIYEEIVKEKER
jgi:hypothetical protein